MPNPVLWQSCHMPPFPLSTPGAQDLSSGSRNYNCLEAKKKLHFSLFSNSGYSRPGSIYQPSPHTPPPLHTLLLSAPWTGSKYSSKFIFLWRKRNHNLNKQQKNANQTKLSRYIRRASVE